MAVREIASVKSGKIAGYETVSGPRVEVDGLRATDIYSPEELARLTQENLVEADELQAHSGNESDQETRSVISESATTTS